MGWTPVREGQYTGDELEPGRIYQGTWGSALFQSIYAPAPGFWGSLPSMPEWYLVIATLTALSALGLFWKPLLLALPLLGYAVGVLLVQAGLSARHVSFASAPQSRSERLQLWGLTTLLYLMQPLARLRGRWRYGLTPWRWRSTRGWAWPWSRTSSCGASSGNALWRGCKRLKRRYGPKALRAFGG